MSRDLSISDHSNESNAFLKSSQARMPPFLSTLVNFTVSLISLIFSPMYLPFKKPDWSVCTNAGNTTSNLLAIAVDAIL